MTNEERAVIEAAVAYVASGVENDKLAYAIAVAVNALEASRTSKNEPPDAAILAANEFESPPMKMGTVTMKVVPPSPEGQTSGGVAEKSAGSAAGDQIDSPDGYSYDEACADVRALRSLLAERDATIAAMSTMHEDMRQHFLKEVARLTAERDAALINLSLEVQACNLAQGAAATNHAEAKRLRAELNAAADALDYVGWRLESPGIDRASAAKHVHEVRDELVRAAATEGA